MKGIKVAELRKIKSIEIENMTASGGGVAPNQFILRIAGMFIFQSYRTTIAVEFPDGRTVLDKNFWDYSVTTGRYRNQFLGCSISECRRRIDSGVYLLADLN